MYWPSNFFSGFPDVITIDNKDNLYIYDFTSNPIACDGLLGCNSPKFNNIMKITPNGKLSSIIKDISIEVTSLVINSKKTILYFTNYQKNKIYKIQLPNQKGDN